MAARLAADCGGNQAVIAQELAKYALYCGAGPETPQPLTHDVLDALLLSARVALGAVLVALVAFVPLFVKEPGQTDGRVDDRNVLSIDILPTIADVHRHSLSLQEHFLDGLARLKGRRSTSVLTFCSLPSVSPLR